MSEILEFKRPSAPSGPTNTQGKHGFDEQVVKWCADWRAFRAQQQKNWAEHDAATMRGTLPDEGIELDLEPLHRMKELESILAEIGKPTTVLAARELLRVCITILAAAYEDPESNLAEGPVLEIVQNVVSSLDWVRPDMRIGPKQPRRLI